MKRVKVYPVGAVREMLGVVELIADEGEMLSHGTKGIVSGYRLPDGAHIGIPWHSIVFCEWGGGG